MTTSPPPFFTQDFFRGWNEAFAKHAERLAHANGTSLQTVSDEDPETGIITEIQFYISRDRKLVVTRHSVKSRTSD